MGGLEGIINSLEDTLIKNSKPIGFVAGAGITLAGSTALYILNNSYPGDDLTFLLGYPLVWGIGYVLGEKVYKKLDRLKSLNELGIKLNKIKKTLTKNNILDKSSLSLSQRITDFFLEHPTFTGVTLGTTLLGTTILGFGVLNNYSGNELLIKFASKPLESTLLLACGAAISSAFYVATKVSARHFHSSSSEFGKKSLELALTYLFQPKNYSDKITIFSEKYDHSYFTYLYANKCIEKGNTTAAFESLLKIYDQQDLLSIPFLWKSDLLRLAEYHLAGSYKRIKNDSTSFSDYFFLALMLRGIDEKQKSLDVMTNFIREADKIDDVRLNANLSYAVFLRKTGEIDKFKEQFVKILRLYSDNLKQIGSYKAYLLAENDFSKKTFVIRKSDDEKVLLSEKEFNKKIKSNFEKTNDEEQFKIIDPPEVVEFNNSFYSATFYENGVALFDYLSREPDKKVFEEIARFMGRIHGANETYEPRETSFYINQLFSRIDEAKDPKLDDLKNIIKENISLLFEGFDKFSRVVDIDGHRENWIVGKHYTKIDNQEREPTIPFYECSKLLEQGNTIPLDSEGDKLKDGVLKNYYDELSNFH
ncbi:MAG: hypothetical protein KKA06_04340, partial [Nanoarchaeota archaeon]|nr:hypothetical protein [Nanoarchaeota archaeon]